MPLHLLDSSVNPISSPMQRDHAASNKGRFSKTRLTLPCLAVLCCLLSACSSGKNDGKAAVKVAPEGFYGTWISQELIVRWHTVNGTDSNMTIQANEASWEEKLGISLIETRFHPNNLYDAAYETADGGPAQRSEGYWELKGEDSIVLHRLKPSPETLRYAWVRKNDSVLGFSGWVDFDGDGEHDDELFSLNRRIAR